MKIGEVKIGAEYGAYDNPSHTYGGNLMPRRVRVLDIVTVAERRHSSAAFSEATTANVRKVRIVLLDEPAESVNTWNRMPITDAPKDAELVIEAKQLAATWEKVRASVGKEMDRRAREKELRAEVESDLRAIGINPDEVYIDVNVLWYDGQKKREWFDIRLHDKQARKVLALAKIGKGKT